jgi:hypothetical protein
MREVRKRFFFEKKKQKTSVGFGPRTFETPMSPGVKVFCFFFSKKKRFFVESCS